MRSNLRHLVVFGRRGLRGNVYAEEDEKCNTGINKPRFGREKIVILFHFPDLETVFMESYSLLLNQNLENLLTFSFSPFLCHISDFLRSKEGVQKSPLR